MFQTRLYLLLCLVFAADTTLSTTVTSLLFFPSTSLVNSSLSTTSSTPGSGQSSLSVDAVTTSMPPVTSTQSVASTSATLSDTPSPTSTAAILPSTSLSFSPSLSSLGGQVSPTSTVQATGVYSASLPSSPPLSSTGGQVSPTSTVLATGTQTTKPTTGTSATGTKDEKYEELKIVGYVIGPIVGGLVVIFIVYYCVVRKRSRNMAIGNDTSMEALAPSGKAAASQKAGPEAGTTHQAFVGDSDSPNKGTVTAAPGVKAV